MDILNHLLVKIKIEERVKEAEHLRLVKLARSAPPTERYSPPQPLHVTHYHVIGCLDPRETSLFILPRHHHRAA